MAVKKPRVKKSETVEFRIGAQLYTLRDYLTDPEELHSALERLKKIGYEGVEVASIPADIPYSAVQAMLAELQLDCVAVHLDSNLILDNPRRAAHCARELQCPRIVYPYPKGIALTSRDDLCDFAGRLSRSADVLARSGMRLCYHNHALEFVWVEGMSIFDWLIGEDILSAMGFELDTHWAQRGGASPAQLCQEIEGRLPILHCKDCVVNPAGESLFAPVGYGNLDWDSIIRAAVKARCTWFVVEQDNCYGQDPYVCLAQSYKTLLGYRSMKVFE
ncbi:MAG: sugar phosphate isomerase/epimerase [Patescibacteria group bacterium]